MARAEMLRLALCLVASALAATGAGGARKTIGVYELRHGDFSVKITNWGTTIMSVILPDSKGNLADVVLGKDTIAEYINDTSFFGPVAGRVAGRIARGRFVLDGKVYHLDINDGRNTLQGGGRGFNKVIWTVKEYVAGGDSPYVTLYYRSFDGEQGFPGDLDVYVTYRLSPYELGVHMNATALGRATPVNLLQHTYWNLGGHGAGDVLGHTLRLHASRYTPLDAEMLPSSGRGAAPVAGTPFDFLAPTPIGARIRGVVGGRVPGYDANYVVDGEPGEMRPVARALDGASGRALELWGNQPAMQLYTANWLNHTKGKGGAVYERYGGFCLETQGYPDAVNHPEFPSQIVRPGQVYRHDMVFKFSF
ncbi:aldose 1-epimerase-like isoform X1 [Sorghum bicolor]|uniref:Aldose 1-epimerase n=1 Tax=Sorghum bicolor TaxID=4558 RepID=A0A1Z5RMG1_SORBI|nr:aldose 1-epimerase-like isoform X1 [Sorghum bicolor]OQU84779.1 hypothetical protein SORBI_3004G120550 [Sorghum bicolor]|eukprot:XP_021316062.1 aldose 1-epimerase-like isoform X1 [Sorghum bicolor]